MNLQVKTFQIFAQWVTFIWQALPPKLQPTLLELLFGAMIARRGHIFSAILSIRTALSWNSYYKAVEQGRFIWLLLAKRWLLLLIDVFQLNELVLTLDDFISVRASKKAPAVGWHFDHAKRSNRPKFLWGQLRLHLSKRLTGSSVSVTSETHACCGQHKQTNHCNLSHETASQAYPIQYTHKSAYRCMVYAWATGSGTAPHGGRRNRAGSQEFCRVSATGDPTQETQGQTSQIWSEAYIRTDREPLPTTTKTVARLWKPAYISVLCGHCKSPVPQSACVQNCLEPILEQLRPLDQLASSRVHRPRPFRRRHYHHLCTAMVDRADVQRIEEHLRPHQRLAKNQTGAGQMEHGSLSGLQLATTAVARAWTRKRCHSVSNTLAYRSSGNCRMDRTSHGTLFLRFPCSPSLGSKVAKISTAETGFLRPIGSSRLIYAVFKQFLQRDYRFSKAA
jgi:hypothetical protein